MSCMFSINELFSRESEPKINSEIRDSSRVWIYPGDGFYTCPTEAVSGEPRPSNFVGIRYPCPSNLSSPDAVASTSTQINGYSSRNRASNINVKFSYEVVHVSTSKTLSDQFCLVVLTNGEAHAHTFDSEIQKWVFNFIFNLKPPTGNDEQILVKSVAFDDDFTSVVWCQTPAESTSAFKSSLFYCQISLNPIRSVSNISINTYPSVCVLKNCPVLNLTFLDGTISCLLEPSLRLNIFLTWSCDSHLVLRNTEGKVILNSLSHNVDFPEILSETVGLWSDSGDRCIFQAVNKVHNTLYILTQQLNVLSLNKSDIISAKIKLTPPVSSENIKGFFVYGLMIILFTLQRVLIHSFECGKLIYAISLDQYEPLIDTWYFTSSNSGSSFGFYGSTKVYQLSPESYKDSIANCCDDNLIKNEYGVDYSQDWVFLSKINELLLKKDGKEIELLSPAIQSPALCLALMHNLKMKNSGTVYFCSNTLDKLLSSNENVETRLGKILGPLVESFIKLEKFRNKMLAE